jgi:hypothetical protein
MPVDLMYTGKYLKVWYTVKNIKILEEKVTRRLHRKSPNEYYLKTHGGCRDHCLISAFPSLSGIVAS